MKKLYFLLAAFLLSVTMYAQNYAGCLEAPEGQFPGDWVDIKPTCNGAVQYIQACHTGEYSVVNVTGETPYKFSSSVLTDFITISNEDGTEVLAAGPSPLNWTSDKDQKIRFYLHKDSNCGYDFSGRARIVQCGDIPAPPVNDDCANAIAVENGQTYTGSTAYANNSDNGKDGFDIAGDVFYKYTGDGTPKIVNLSLCGSSYDTMLKVYTDCSFSHQIAVNDDFCDKASFASFQSDGTSTYIIVVDGHTYNTGDFVLSVSTVDGPPAPDNDNCVDVVPTTLTNGTPVTFHGTTIGATAAESEYQEFGYGAVWEAVTLTGECNILTVDYCGTPVGNMNNTMQSLTPCPIAGRLGGVMDWTICPDENGTIKFYNLPAGTYYIPVVVDPDSNTLGEYTMNVISEDCPGAPANDDCENAFPIAAGESDSGLTLYATDSGGEPAKDVFYKYTGNGKPELVTVSLAGSDYDTLLRVFTDCTLNKEIKNRPSTLQFESDGTSTYIIMVEGYGDAVGSYKIKVDAEDAPIYDPCAPEYTNGKITNAAGLLNDGNTKDISANDFYVVKNSEFTINQITLDILTAQGQPTTFDLSFYDGEEGVGNQIGETLKGLVPTSITPTGTVQSGISTSLRYDVVLTLPTPITFSASSDSDKRYWVGVSSPLSDEGQFVYWAAPEYLSTSTLPTWQSTDNGATWNIFAEGFETEGNMKIDGECQTLGTSDVTSTGINFYPNPVKDVLNISADQKITSVSIYNVAGQKVINNVKANNGKVNVSRLVAGTYIVTTILENGKTETFKVIKK